MSRRIKRVRHWEGALARAINEAREQPFAYGKHDCALMACTIVKAFTGVDFAKDWRGTYITCPEEDVGDIATDVAAKHGLAEIPIRMARRGDFILLSHKRLGKSLGVVDTTGRTAVFPRKNGGIERIAVLKCSRAWRV